MWVRRTSLPRRHAHVCLPRTLHAPLKQWAKDDGSFQERRHERMPSRRLKATRWRFVKANLRLHKSVGWAFASPSIFNKTWKVTEFYEPSKQPLRRCSFFYGRTDEHPFFSFLFFTPSRCPCQSAWRSWIFHQRKKSRQGQGRWMTSMASRYFQGRVIETNEPCYISWDTESRRPEDPAADRAETGGTQPFHRSPESGCSSKVFSKWLQNMLLSLTHTHTHAQGQAHTSTYCLTFKDFPFSFFQTGSFRCAEQIRGHYLIHNVPLASGVLLNNCKHVPSWIIYPQRHWMFNVIKLKCCHRDRLCLPACDQICEAVKKKKKRKKKSISWLCFAPGSTRAGVSRLRRWMSLAGGLKLTCICAGGARQELAFAVTSISVCLLFCFI